jgi:hypothetical protein
VSAANDEFPQKDLMTSCCHVVIDRLEVAIKVLSSTMQSRLRYHLSSLNDHYTIKVPSTAMDILQPCHVHMIEQEFYSLCNLFSYAVKLPSKCDNTEDSLIVAT